MFLLILAIAPDDNTLYLPACHACTGTRLVMVLKGLAAAYRGEETSHFLPKALLPRHLWPWHLAEHLTAEQREGLDYPAADSQEAQEMQQSQVRGNHLQARMLTCMHMPPCW